MRVKHHNFNENFKGTQELRRSLVQSMKDKGVLHTPAIENAFATVPREAFVPLFYERDPNTTKMVWLERSLAHMALDDYVNLVYRDEPLVTLVDSRQWPCSSSSMPSAMAQMLEALNLQRGQRVLEIGTGTGYNAALIAHIVGSPELVTTIDYSEMLTQRAADTLNLVVGNGIQVHRGDGFFGVASGAPYHRIIATASAPTVPRTWVEQLAPGGRLVMDLQGNLGASGFLVLDKLSEGQGAKGEFLPQPLHFMPLISSSLSANEFAKSVMSQPFSALLHTPPQYVLTLDAAPENEHPFPDVLIQETTLRWMLQWQYPTYQISQRSQRHEGTMQRSVIVVDEEQPHQALLRFRQVAGDAWRLELYGELEVSRQLYDQLYQTYKTWTIFGRPAPKDYLVLIDANYRITLSVGNVHVTLPTSLVST